MQRGQAPELAAQECAQRDEHECAQAEEHADSRKDPDAPHSGRDLKERSPHELLHLLGGLHGGPESLIQDPFKTKLGDAVVNCKPYPGVDKYSGQIPDTYLISTLVEPGNLQSNVTAGSDWQLTYSDGSHGINPFEEFVLFGTEGSDHVNDMQALGGTLGGLNETNLYEDTSAGLPGTPYTMTWATPGSSHTGPHATHTQFSDGSGPLPFGPASNTPFAEDKIDWDDSESIAGIGTNATADINNYGFPGCITLAGDEPDPIMFDYDAFYHMDFVFQDTSTGQFDGLTNFQIEVTEGRLHPGPHK